jgi:excisionase family DNA binding protein
MFVVDSESLDLIRCELEMIRRSYKDLERSISHFLIGARLSTAEAAARIGVTRQTLAKMVHERRFPAPKAGKYLLIDILRWEDEQSASKFQKPHIRKNST